MIRVSEPASNPAHPFDPDQLRLIVQRAEAAYPNEGCGLIVGRAWADARLVETENLYDRYHQRDPERYPRTNATAYLIHPLKLMQAVEEAGGLLAIWHSHADVGAYFSAEDVRVALGGGDAPLWPGTAYLVVSCRQGRVDALKRFDWDPVAHVFAETQVPLPPA